MEIDSKKNRQRDPHRGYTILVPSGSVGETQKRIIKRMKKTVFGQDRAVRRAVRAISIFEAKMGDGQRPVGCLLFAGPSGTGKTFTAKQLAYAWIGEPEKGLDPAVFVDCGSLSLEHERATLTGSPPGYIGYGDEVGLEQVGAYERKKRGKSKKEYVKEIEDWLEIHPEVKYVPGLGNKVGPFIKALLAEIEQLGGPFRSVVIFDEFEKAHVNVQRQLLSILEEGKIRLQNGRLVDFTGSLIILTTNVGTQQIQEEYLGGQRIGFKSPAKERVKESNGLDRAIWKRVLREIESRKYFLPELLGRIGKPGIIVFRTLKYNHYLKILDVELQKVQGLLSGRSGSGPPPILISYDKKFKSFLIEEGADPRYGARALRSVVDKFVREPLSNAIESGKVRMGDKILFKVSFVEEAAEDGEQARGPKVEIRRQPRPFGRKSPPFGPQKRGRAEPSVKKILDDFLADQFPPALPEAKNNQEGA